MKLTAYIIPAFAAALGTVLFVKGAAANQSGSCYAIQDADARQYCLAKARREPAQCYAVQRADLRSQCLAEVRK